MPDGSNLIYQYDGSFEGLLCCVFESYEKKEIPLDIIVADTPQTTLLPIRDIVTDEEKARRVLVSIPKKMGKETLDFIRRAFLTCLPYKEKEILLFLRLGYRVGNSVLNLLTNDTVHTLTKAVKYLNNESNQFRQFIRFSIFQGAMVAEIEPNNFVLPLLVEHFRNRYPEEKFLIYDKSHGMALIYQPYHAEIVAIESLELPEPDEEEYYFQDLWRLFYNTIEVEGRHNPKCRMSHMPKRYWKYMTEFAPPRRKRPGMEPKYEPNPVLLSSSRARPDTPLLPDGQG